MASNTTKFDYMYREVSQMLQEIYSPNKVPEFEVNSKTVPILHQVLTQMCQEKDSRNTTDVHYKNLTHFYEAKGKEIQENLQSMGLSLEDAPAECKEAIKALATTALILNLDQPTITNFLLGINHFQQEELDLENEKQSVRVAEANITKKLDEVVSRKCELELEIETAKECEKTRLGEEEKRKLQTGFIQSKTVEYAKRVDEEEKTLKQLGFREELSHPSIMNKFEELNVKMKNLKEIDAKLASYCDLPPNYSLAKLKIEEARQQLLALKQEVQRRLDSGQK